MSLSILSTLALRLSRGDSLSYLAGSGTGPHMHITAVDDEDIVRLLVGAGALVTEPRRTVGHDRREWDVTDLTLDGVDVYVSTPHRDVRDVLVDQLAETADRLRAGESLADVREKPLRLVGEVR